MPLQTTVVRSAGHYGTYLSPVHGRSKLPYASTHHTPQKLHGRQRGSRLPSSATKDVWGGKGAMKNH